MPAPTAQPLRSAPRALLALVLALCAALLAGCGAGGGVGDSNPAAEARSLAQFGYVSGTGQYVYGHDSIARIPITGVPAGADMSRYAMAGDGSNYWLLCMDAHDPTDLHVFRYSAGAYEAIGLTAHIRSAPADADFGSFALLHNGDSFRLYLRSKADPTTLYQFSAATLALSLTYGGGGASAILDTTGAPPDADFSRWTMFHDGSRYRQAIFRKGSYDTLYQFGWNGGSYAYGYASTDVIYIVGAPQDTYKAQAKILHDGDRYRLYQLAP